MVIVFGMCCEVGLESCVFVNVVGWWFYGTIVRKYEDFYMVVVRVFNDRVY